MGLEVGTGERSDRRLKGEVDRDQTGKERGSALSLPPAAPCRQGPVCTEVPDAGGDAGGEDEKGEGPELPVEQRSMEIEEGPSPVHARHAGKASAGRHLFGRAGWPRANERASIG